MTERSVGTFVENHQTMQVIVDETDIYTYIGEAALGELKSTAKWKIHRLTLATNHLEKANGNDAFEDAWVNRARLSYA